MKEIFIFIISMLIPLLYYRTLSYIAKDYMKKPFLRTKTNLQIHHLHYGIILIFVASLLLLFLRNNTIIVILLGLGLGLMFDLFIPSILMKSNRKIELEVYRRTFIKTLILFAIIILVIILISLFI